MILCRRFLVIQALLIWQGGFLFYAAVVVPIGSSQLGSLTQGRVTQHVTDAMNAIGIVSLAILAWDGWFDASPSRFRRVRWILWDILFAGVVSLILMHREIESYLSSSSEFSITNYPAFYDWHRAYLIVATLQWLCATVYVVVTLRLWSESPRAGE